MSGARNRAPAEPPGRRDDHRIPLSPAAREAERVFLRRVLIVLAIAAVALLLWRLAELLLLAFGAVLVAVLLRALAAPLVRMHLPMRWALLTVVLALAAFVGAGAWLFGAEVAAQVRILQETVPDAWRSFERRLGEVSLGERILEELRTAAPEGAALAQGLQRFVVTLGGALAGTFLVIAGGVYLAAQPQLYRRGLLKLVPQTRRALIEETLDDAGRALRLWLVGQLAAMIAIGVLTGAGLALIGVPSALALGLLAGLAEFVPVIGPLLAAVPALLLALAQGPDVALWTLALYVVLQQIEGNLVTPLVQERAVSLPPALTLFALIAAGLVLGIGGVLLAAPLTVVVYVAVKRLYVQEALDTPTPIPGDRSAHEP